MWGPVRKLNLSELEWLPYAIAPGVGGDVRDVGRAVGTRNVGLRIQRIPPGARASRRHRHLFQEELLVVVRGEGTLVHGEEHVAVRSGDFVSYHAGDPEAHTLENTGQGVLEVWAFGDRVPHEVCVYPDEQVAYVEALGGDVPLSDVEAWATLAGRGTGIEPASPDEAEE
jgi:uncharacterized cupin superfamily protein